MNLIPVLADAPTPTCGTGTGSRPLYLIVVPWLFVVPRSVPRAVTAAASGAAGVASLSTTAIVTSVSTSLSTSVSVSTSVPAARSRMGTISVPPRVTIPAITKYMFICNTLYPIR